MMLITRTSWTVTVLQLLGSVIAVAFDSTPRAVVAVGFVILLLVGSGLFLVALVVAAGRSREEQVSVAGVFFLADGSTERGPRLELTGNLAAQVVIGVVAAASAPFTAVAFSTLVPMMGLGLMAIAGARHGHFEPLTNQ